MKTNRDAVAFRESIGTLSNGITYQANYLYLLQRNKVSVAKDAEVPWVIKFPIPSGQALCGHSALGIIGYGVLLFLSTYNIVVDWPHHIVDGEQHSIHIYEHIEAETRWPTFSQTFSNADSWMKTCEFRSRFHWSLFIKVQLTNFPAMVQIMARRRTVNKPLFEPMAT